LKILGISNKKCICFDKYILTGSSIPADMITYNELLTNPEYWITKIQLEDLGNFM